MRGRKARLAVELHISLKKIQFNRLREQAPIQHLATDNWMLGILQGQQKLIS
jgi:hypothetical protein